MRVLLSLLCGAALASQGVAFPMNHLIQSGKRLYWMYFMKGDGVRPDDKDQLLKMQAEHLDNMGKLFEQKKLIAAGPLKDPTEQRRGICVLTIKDEKELASLFKGDPYVENRIMTVQAFPWTADMSRIRLDYPDPDAIEENRLVVLTGKRDGAIPKPIIDRHLKHVARMQPSIGGPLKTGKGYAEVLLFQGSEQESLEREMKNNPLVKEGFATFEIMPLWMAKGTLIPRQSK